MLCARCFHFLRVFLCFHFFYHILQDKQKQPINNILEWTCWVSSLITYPSFYTLKLKLFVVFIERFSLSFPNNSCFNYSFDTWSTQSKHRVVNTSNEWIVNWIPIVCQSDTILLLRVLSVWVRIIYSNFLLSL